MADCAGSSALGRNLHQQPASSGAPMPDALVTVVNPNGTAAPPAFAYDGDTVKVGFTHLQKY